MAMARSSCDSGSTLTVGMEVVAPILVGFRVPPIGRAVDVTLVVVAFPLMGCRCILALSSAASGLHFIVVLSVLRQFAERLLFSLRSY